MNHFTVIPDSFGDADTCPRCLNEKLNQNKECVSCEYKNKINENQRYCSLSVLQ